MAQAQATAQLDQTDTGHRMQISFSSGEAYEVAVRGHRLLVDQPVDAGGQDRAATPTELFVASLATCVAFYAGRFLTRHGYNRDGLAVTADFTMGSDRPARVSNIRLSVHVPADLPEARRPALAAVVTHCTVHNSLTIPPDVTIDLT